MGRNATFLIIAILAGMILGFWRTGTSMIDANIAQQFNGQQVIVSGTVSDDPEIKGDSNLLLRLGNISVNNLTMSGDIMISTSKRSDIRRDDVISVEGEMSAGFGRFYGSMFQGDVLEIKRPVPGKVFTRVRSAFSNSVKNYISEPESDLALSYLLGQRRGLGDEMTDLLRVTGLIHLVVASGFHLGIIVGFAKKLFKRVSRFAILFFSLLLIFSFVAITGASPSMVRASIVAVLGLVAWYIGRKIHPVSVLLITAAITLSISPFYIVDVGWQLSFAAFFGVLVLAPVITRFFYDRKKLGYVRSLLVVCISAQVMTLPLVSYYFSSISLVSVIANLLVMPTVPVVMLTTFITGLSGIFIPMVGVIFGAVTTFILKYTLFIISNLGSLNWASREVEIDILGVCAMYVVILVILFLMHKTSGSSFVSKKYSNDIIE